MLVLTWNLFHGRAQPPAGRDLFDEYAATLAGWEWDVALLQEVPPWWPVPLGRAARASARMALTSRNTLLPVRRFVAERAPDLIKANGGGCNAILVRGETIAEHRRAGLRRRPERRVVHAVRLAGGVWAANLHVCKRDPHPERPARDMRRAGEALELWTRGAPAVVGGDFNVPDPAVAGFARAGGRGVDHVLARGLRAGATRRLDAGRLSDHPPLLVELHR